MANPSPTAGAGMRPLGNGASLTPRQTSHGLRRNWAVSEGDGDERIDLQLSNESQDPALKKVVLYNLNRAESDPVEHRLMS